MTMQPAYHECEARCLLWTENMRIHAKRAAVVSNDFDRPPGLVTRSI